MIHMLAEDLRASVLKAAFEGKLTKQNTNDDSVYETLKLQNIRAIESEDFDSLPKNWALVSFGDISTYCKSKRKINAKIADPNLWMLDLEDIEKGGKLLVKKKVKDKKAIGDKTIFEKGDILYSKLRPYLLKILIADEGGVCTPELVPFKMTGNVNSLFTMYYLKSPYVDQKVNKETFGVKMPRVGTETMKSLAFPLPPVEEQIRIVSRIEELMVKIEEYEKIENNLVKLQSVFPGEMKASLMQSAMQGELSKHIDFSSNSKDYLNGITKRLNFKKTIEQSIIEKPYDDLPARWTYTCLKNICEIQTGKRDANFGDENGNFPFFTCAKNPIKSKTYSYEMNAILIAGNGDISNISRYKGKFEAYQRTYILKMDDFLNDKFIFYAIKDRWLRYNKDKMFGSAIPYVRLGNLENYSIPFPPSEEQQYIVSLLDKALPLCDSFDQD